MEENNKAVEASKTEEKQTKLDETEYLIASSGTAPAEQCDGAAKKRTTNMTGLMVAGSDRKKFGLIRPDGSDKEPLLYISDLPNRQPIPVNTPVQFELGIYGGRRKTVKVEVEK